MSALFAADVTSGFFEDMSGGELAIGAVVIVILGISIALIVKGFRGRPPRD
ncbi:hypothetical protein sos41_04580 [Alphaproteobacteria bacterium SO-S41]|nr:hypothetical protein sos41_04580 [Alphaproteobacteria bacterium SO-S41]